MRVQLQIHVDSWAIFETVRGTYQSHYGMQHLGSSHTHRTATSLHKTGLLVTLPIAPQKLVENLCKLGELQGRQPANDSGILIPPAA